MGATETFPITGQPSPTETFSKYGAFMRHLELCSYSFRARDSPEAVVRVSDSSQQLAYSLCEVGDPLGAPPPGGGRL